MIILKIKQIVLLSVPKRFKTPKSWKLGRRWSEMSYCSFRVDVSRVVHCVRLPRRRRGPIQMEHRIVLSMHCLWKVSGPWLAKCRQMVVSFLLVAVRTVGLVMWVS